MAEFSMPWATNGVGDGDWTYNQRQTNAFFRRAHQASDSLSESGVLFGFGDSLIPSLLVATSPVVIKTGQGMVYGFRYTNDANVNVAIPTPLIGDTGHIVLLRASWAAQTVRIALRSSADGNSAIPALTQTAGTTWEVPLCQVVIDLAGNMWSDATKTVVGPGDLRSFVVSPLASRVKLRDQAVGGLTSYRVEFIQQNLNALEIILTARSTVAATDIAVNIRFNGDATNSYSYVRYTWQNAAAAVATSTAATQIPIGRIVGNTGGALYSDTIRVLIPAYSDVGDYKQAICQGTTADTGAAATVAMTRYAGWWRNTAAIKSIEIFSASTFNAGAGISNVSIYGLR